MKITIALAVLALAGCGSKKDKEDKAPAVPTTEAAKPAEGAATATKPAEPEKPKASGRSMPNSKGLVLDAPAKWEDNGIGGAAGFHMADDQGMLMMSEVSPEEANKPFDVTKKETEEILFEKWVTSDKTADGFKFVYVIPKLAMKGDEMEKVGTQFAFTVRRKVGPTLYNCTGTAATKEIAEEAVALCDKVAAE